MYEQHTTLAVIYSLLLRDIFSLLYIILSILYYSSVVGVSVVELSSSTVSEEFLGYLCAGMHAFLFHR